MSKPNTAPEQQPEPPAPEQAALALLKQIAASGKAIEGMLNRLITIGKENELLLRKIAKVRRMSPDEVDFARSIRHKADGKN